MSDAAALKARKEAAQQYLNASGILDDVVEALSRYAVERPQQSPHQYVAQALLDKVNNRAATAGSVQILRIRPDSADEKKAADRPLRIIIAGAPASGKGTQCELIAQKFGVVHISTGDRLRAEVAAGSALGQEAKTYMDQGLLVPDEIMNKLVAQVVNTQECKERGWLLDGFPRTRAQAVALADAGVVADAFVLIDVPDDVLIERVVGRRLDKETGKIYHLKFNPPPADVAADRLEQRSDDTEEKAKVRIEKYHENIDRIVAEHTGLIVKVNGNRDKTQVFSQISKYLSTLQSIAEDLPPASPASAFVSEPAPVDAAPAAEPEVKRALRIIVGGAPGSGKSAQASLIASTYGLALVNVDDLVKEAVAQNTPLGAAAKESLDKAEPVPDNVLVELVKERLASASNGWVIDDFPRTRAQADALAAAGVDVDVFIVLDAEDAVLLDRSTNRRFDPETGRFYHLSSNPPDGDVANRVVQRPEDDAGKVQERIGAFRNDFHNVTEVFAAKVTTVDASPAQDQVFQQVQAKLQA